MLDIRVPRPYKLYNLVAARLRPGRPDAAEISQVLAAYELGQLKGYRQPAIGPSRSRNLMLDLGNGWKVLKRYKSTMSFEGITYEHSVLMHLADSGFPSPRLILDKTGETCLALAGKYYALFDFVPGFKYTDYYVSAKARAFFLAQAGQTLARYHQIMEGFVPAGKKLDGFAPDGQRRWLAKSWYLDRLAEYAALFRKGDSGSALEQFFAANLDRLARSYGDLEKKVEENRGRLPKVVNHGDYGPYNILFDKEGVAAVLDFECVHLDCRATDVIQALRYFAGRDVGTDHKVALDYAGARVFLQAYASIYPLSVGEIELIPDISRLALLRKLVNYFRDYFASGNLLKLHSARRAAAWVDWMSGHGDSLIEVLLAFKPAGV